MAKETEATNEQKLRKVENLIRQIEKLIKVKLGDKTFCKNYPFIKESEPAAESEPDYSLPLALKNFGKEEEKNWIFYGPPGTGKTFALNKLSSDNYILNNYEYTSEDFDNENKIKTDFLEKNKFWRLWFKLDESAEITDKIRILYRYLSLPFLKFGIKLFIKGHRKKELSEGHPQFLDLTKMSKQNANAIIKIYNSEIQNLTPSNYVLRTPPQGYSKLDNNNISLPIGFNPNYHKSDDITDEIKDVIVEAVEDICDKILKYITLTLAVVKKIVFHPSYTYEDFVGGIKPDLVQIPLMGTPPKPSGPSSPNSLTYKYTLGVMLDLIRKAWVKEGVRHYLIIDEFNRGNIAAIFGEFLYLIENDKRSKDKNSGVDYVFLPGGVYPWDDKEKVEPFSEECKIRMPENIFIVGALNTADRSIATMDFAMRRRFNFVKFEPNEELIKGFNWIKPDDKIDADNYLKILFLSLNKSINYKLDADHEIGHYYFMPTPESVKNTTEIFIVDLFERKIIPLLEAYCDHDEQAVNRILALTKKIMFETCSLDDGKITFDELTSQKIKDSDRLFNKFDNFNRKCVYGCYLKIKNPNGKITIDNEPEFSLQIPQTLPS